MKHFTKKKNNKAFTLAEILITIGIIGVVSAITIPAIISHYHKREIENKLYKINSTILQGIRMVQANTDSDFSVVKSGDEHDNSAGHSWESSKQVFEDNFSLGFKVVTKYPKNTLFDVYSADGSTKIGTLGYYYMVGLLDGTILEFFAVNENKFDIAVILNPQKSKLVSGRDVFTLTYRADKNGNWYNDYKFYGNEFNYEEFRQHCISNEEYPALYSHPYAFCSSLIVKNGYKIPSDYPIKL
ncbi:type II secretion system protein [bacterium]|nr:type II secretion system protein [bacterium]